MKFTVVSHAGLLVESNGRSLLTDPWLIGSCYWRSWWNYPPPPPELIDRLKPDFIYLTHLHWDHFHSPSLRRFDPGTLVLVPRAHFDRMLHDLRSLGFRNVRELTHGVSEKMPGGFALTSFQFRLSLDSALVIEAGGVTVLNANDCKLMGGPLWHLKRKFPKIDFVLRSHSSASSYPYCVSSDYPEHLNHREREDYLREFLVFCESLRTRYAVPFASNHCFLHQETFHFNETVVSPYDVKRYFDAHRRDMTECQVMIPGDSWSSEEGFSLAKRDYFTRREEHLQALQERHAAALSAYYEREDAVRPDWKSFERYFLMLLASLPPGFSFLFPARALFHAQGATSAFWLVDFRAREVTQADPETPHDFKLTTHPAILKDCCQNRMFSVFTASKRVRYHLKTRRALLYYHLFNSLMDMYESGYFPLSRMANRRFIGNWLRRWREILFYASIAPGILAGWKFQPANHMRTRAAPITSSVG